MTYYVQIITQQKLNDYYYVHNTDYKYGNSECFHWFLLLSKNYTLIAEHIQGKPSDWEFLE